MTKKIDKTKNKKRLNRNDLNKKVDETKVLKIFNKRLKEFIKWLNESDSILVDITYLILFYIAIRFIMFPILSTITGAEYPLVAIVSTSMEHNNLNFDAWWNSKPCNMCLTQKEWYSKFNITYEQFKNFPWPNGLNKGDVMVLKYKEPEKIKIGDILVFKAPSGKAVIHRVVKKWNEDGKWYFQTKGDRNPDSSNSVFIRETRISEEQIIGVAVFRIPYLGLPKAWFQDMIDKIKK